MTHITDGYLIQLELGSKSKAVNCICTNIRPLTKFLRGFGEGHVRCDSRVDNSLKRNKYLFM